MLSSLLYRDMFLVFGLSSLVISGQGEVHPFYINYTRPDLSTHWRNIVQSHCKMTVKFNQQKLKKNLLKGRGCITEQFQ